MAISDVLTALRMDHCTGIRMDHLRFDIDTHQDAMHPKHQCQKKPIISYFCVLLCENNLTNDMTL